MRLDQAIAARFPAISRRKARQMIAAGNVLVNHRPVSIASREIEDGDHIAILEERPRVPLLAMTDEWLAVNKPAGMHTQPTRGLRQLSLEDIVRAEYKRIWLVHRLDTPTSGVIVFARTPESAAQLSKLFASREIRKTYLARVAPPIAHETLIDAPIDGKEAITIVRPHERDLVQAEIKTGRMHQIRIHLASVGHPIVGDRRYGGLAAPRLMLHAWKLEHQTIGTLEAPPPDDLIPSPGDG